ncbi:MAG TPA: PAS domain S-box protein [Bryobacteraceae bacterium]|nr:PAS domain S-box protein [Bryobacteraceae bacterium]
MYMTDAQGRLTYFNAAAVALSGRVPELGTDQWCVTWKIFLPEGTQLPNDRCPMAIALKGGQVPTGLEYIGERPDGARFWFTPCPAVLRDAEGRIIGGINILVDITERKSAEMEANEHFRTIVETTPECVKIVAGDGTLLHMNSAGLALVGASSGETLTGRSVYELIAPEDRSSFREFNQRICQGEKGSLEFDLIGLNGVRRRMEAHAAPLRHSDGTTVQLAITRDVTKRKRAERAALLLGAIVDSSDDAIISKDLDGIITSWNVSAERLFGYTAGEVIGKPVTILIPADRLDEEPRILSRLRRGERVDHFETIRKRKDGELLDISLTISPVKDQHGTIIGVSKIARDITERKRAQAALLASEARFRQLADAMPQIVWTARPDGYLDYYNERWYEFTGFSRDTYGDMSWEPILHPDDVRHCRDTWYASVRSGEPYHIEYRFWDRREQRWRWFMGRALAVRDADGNVVKWFGSCTDIDAQKCVEDDLRRANQDLEQFAFSASHDLQEPLRTVKIYSELLTNTCATQLEGQALEFLSYLRAGATRMETLLRDLLTYTQATKFEEPPQPTDSGEAFKFTLANLAGAISEAGARITADPLPSLRVHTAHLQQLFQNLIGNAIKYRSPDRPPAVHVTAERQNASWIFAISDNGIGIDSEYKEKIFGLFKRLHTSDEYSGTGIGLAICRRIVEQYHGRIWVESEPGQGSVFRFTLPV